MANIKYEECLKDWRIKRKAIYCWQKYEMQQSLSEEKEQKSWRLLNYHVIK